MQFQTFGQIANGLIAGDSVLIDGGEWEIQEIFEDGAFCAMSIHGSELWFDLDDIDQQPPAGEPKTFAFWVKG